MDRQLRTRTKQIDYRALHNGTRISVAGCYRATLPANTIERIPTRMLTRLEHQINFNLLRLLNFRVSNRIVQFKIEIDNKVYSYLKAKYNLNSRFQQAANTVLQDFNLIQEKLCPNNPRNRIKIDTSYFLIRLYKKKDVFFENRKVIAPFFVYFKFGKLNQVLW
jgi:hypothetical protein